MPTSSIDQYIERLGSVLSNDQNDTKLMSDIEDYSSGFDAFLFGYGWNEQRFLTEIDKLWE